ncbi:hypothetical protein BBD42_04290 [Paenibacillus sp. BIHB 4019]|uniref:Uncharacterized protein n=1 Tax=Paenibacillus sp. BIHB 4019 TaxID=1870819 RepID=A0A1B2DDI3_9BACL|nr:DUF58 domain-containing protein [Paenibacillus sp. BIHB 4019]ANY65772.1 hypothetical protein BBD42_04290 [Paenibacillus sp. BIHB 4019]
MAVSSADNEAVKLGQADAGEGQAKAADTEHEAEAEQELGQQRLGRIRWGGWLLLLSGWCAALAAVIQRGMAVEWFMFAVLGCIMLLSAGLPWLAMRGMEVRRMLGEGTIRDGGEVEVQLMLGRAFPIPFVWLALEDTMVNGSTAKQERVSYRYAAQLHFETRLALSYRAQLIRRGEHSFEAVTVTASDYLGLTAVSRTFACRSGLLAVPALPEAVAAPGAAVLRGSGLATIIRLHPGKMDAQEAGLGREPSEGQHSGRQAGIGPEMRPYRDGDSLRHVNWKAAARGRGLHTKEHGTALHRPLVLLAIDNTAVAYAGDERFFDACAGWAAGVLEQDHLAGNRVQLIAGQAVLDDGGTRGKVKEASILPSVSGQSDNGAGMYSGAEVDEGQERDVGSLANAEINAWPETGAYEDNSTAASMQELLEQLARLKLVQHGRFVARVIGELDQMPRGGILRCFTADWRNSASWGQMASRAAEQGCQVLLYMLIKQSTPSFAMREQQKWLESFGVRTYWLTYPERMNEQPQLTKGRIRYGDI